MKLMYHFTWIAKLNEILRAKNVARTVTWNMRNHGGVKRIIHTPILPHANNLYLKGRATYLERSSLSKLTKPKCSWLRVNTTKYLKFIAITFVFQNNAPFSKKNNKWRILLCCSNPTNELTFFVYLLWLSSYAFF